MDALQIANSLPMWIACGGAVVLVIVQALIFIKKAMDAAPQVGVLRRVVVIEVEEGKVIELINPRIIATAGTQEEIEGCLSVPGVYKDVTRPMRVKVRAQNRKGENIVVEGEGLMARALCHEIDHLDGVVFLDRAEK